MFSGEFDPTGKFSCVRDRVKLMLLSWNSNFLVSTKIMSCVSFVLPTAFCVAGTRMFFLSILLNDKVHVTLAGRADSKNGI